MRANRSKFGFFCAGAVSLIIALARAAQAQYLTVYGGPTYSSTSGGITGQAQGDTNSGDSNTIVVNNAGQAVGYGQLYESSTNYKGDRSFRIDGSGHPVQQLGDLGTGTAGGTSNYAYTHAFAINDSGTTVGSSLKFDGSGNNLGSRAVQWNNAGAPTEMATLGTDSYGSNGFSAAYAINQSGTSVGTSWKYDAAW